MNTLSIVLISYIVVSQVVTMTVIFSRKGKDVWWLLLIVYPFGLLVSLIDDLLRKKRKLKPMKAGKEE